MPSVALEETRNALRSAALKRRAALDPAICRSWSRSIQAKTLELPQYLSARSVAVYRAIGNEVATDTIIQRALEHAKNVFVAKLGTEEPGGFVAISSSGSEYSSEYSKEQYGAQSITIRGIEWNPTARDDLIVIVPGVLFDYQGNRLGRGGGWYDRALRSLGAGSYVGLAYDLQVIDRMPVQPWDERVHYVITESRVIDCSEQRLKGIAR